jgi:hypothetical protein
LPDLASKLIRKTFEMFSKFILSLFLLLSFCRVTSLPEGVIIGFQNFAWGYNSQQTKIGVETNLFLSPFFFMPGYFEVFSLFLSDELLLSQKGLS